MAENIIGVPEKVELHVGDALEARNVALSSFIGLGPPDLVVLLKHYTPPKLLLMKPTFQSSYHWALGVDVSSSAAVAAYFGGLLEHQDKAAFGRGRHDVVKCTYSSFNAFKKMDLRVQILVPEDNTPGYVIDACAVDVGGHRVEIDEQFWQETFICAMLRALNGPPKNVQPIHIKDVVQDVISETHFLTFCAEHFWSGRKLGTTATDAITKADCSNNLLTTSLCKYFTKMNRFERIISFFEPFYESDPLCAVMMAEADSQLDNPLDGITLLQDALSKRPESASLMLALAEINLRHLPTEQTLKDERLLDALRFTLKCIARQSAYPKGWWTLTRALIEMNRFDWALVVMNYAPSLPFHGADVVDQIGVAPFEKLTNSQVAHPHIASVLQEEENVFLSMPAEDSLRLLSALTLSKDGKQAYELLEEMVARSGWENVTQLRANVLEHPATLLRRSQQFTFEDSPSFINPYTREDITATPTLPQAPVSDKTAEAQQNPQLATENAGENENTAKEEDVDKKDIVAEGETRQEPELHVPSAQALKRLDVLPASTFLSLNSSSGGLPLVDLTERSPADEKQDASASAETTTTTTATTPTTTPATTAALTTQQGVRKEELGAGGIQDAKKPELVADTSRDIPDVTIENLTEVDDALSKFLIRTTAMRCSLPQNKVRTTPMHMEDPSSPMIPILGISRTLELAFHALFQDIKAFHSWKEEVKKKNVRNENLTTKVNPQRTTADWIHLAMLCERLDFIEDAELIYRMVAPQNVKALTAVVRLDAERGDIRNALIGATQVLNYYFDKYHVKQIHPEVINAVLKLVSIHGLQKVRSIQVPDVHPQLANILLEATRWGSKGYDL